MLPPSVNLLDLALDIQVAIFERIPVRQRYATLLPVSKSVAPALHACLKSCRVSIEGECADLLGAADRLSLSPHSTSLSFALRWPTFADGDDVRLLPKESSLRLAMDGFWARAAELRVGLKLASLSVHTALLTPPTVASLLQFMRGLPDLRAVTLGGFVDLSDLCGLTKLRTVVLSDTCFTLAELAEALSMPFLEVLRLDDVFLTHFEWPKAGALDAALARARLREFSLNLTDPIEAPVASQQLFFSSLFKAPELRVLELRLHEPTLRVAGHLPPLLEVLAADFRLSEDAVFPPSLRKLACCGRELSRLPSEARLEKLVLLDLLDASSLSELLRRLAESEFCRLTRLEVNVPCTHVNPDLEERGVRRLRELFAKVAELGGLRAFEPKFDPQCDLAASFQSEMIRWFLQSPPRYRALTGFGACIVPPERVLPPPGEPDLIDFECATRLQWTSRQPWRAERLEHLTTSDLRTLCFAAGTFGELKHLHFVEDDSTGGIDEAGIRERRIVEAAARFAPVQTLHVSFTCVETWALELSGSRANFRAFCDWIEALGASRLRLTLSWRVWRNVRVCHFKLAMSLLASCKCLASIRVDTYPDEDDDGFDYEYDDPADHEGDMGDMDVDAFHIQCLLSCGLSSDRADVFSCTHFVSVLLNDANRARILEATEVIEM